PSWTSRKSMRSPRAIAYFSSRSTTVSLPSGLIVMGVRLATGNPSHAAAVPRQRAGGVDDPHVAVRLRHVAQLPSVVRVELLGEQAHVVADVQDTLEELPPFVGLADEMQVVGQPDRADDEGALLAAEPVAAVVVVVAKDEAVLQQLVPHR